MNRLTRTALAAGAAVTLIAGASSLTASAAPLGQNLESLKAAASNHATDVQYYRRHRNRGAAIALGAFGVGVIAGAAINSNRGYYYDQPYGYEQPYGYYQQPYGYYGRSYGYTPNGDSNPYGAQ